MYRLSRKVAGRGLSSWPSRLVIILWSFFVRPATSVEQPSKHCCFSPSQQLQSQHGGGSVGIAQADVEDGAKLLVRRFTQNQSWRKINKLDFQRYCGGNAPTVLCSLKMSWFTLFERFFHLCYGLLATLSRQKPCGGNGESHPLQFFGPFRPLVLEFLHSITLDLTQRR